MWTQLWASWTLPLAWGFTYRALSSLRAAFPAVLFIMLTVALHYETGYLAFVPLVVWPFIVPVGPVAAARPRRGPRARRRWRRRPGSSCRCWTSPTGRRATRCSRARASRTATAPARCCRGCSRATSTTTGRWPVVTILVGVGLAVCLVRWRTNLAGRALVSIWVVTLLMTFGRTTFGSLYDIVPGSSDIFIRRFQMGVQLSGILLAGIGIVTVGRWSLDARTGPLARGATALGLRTGRPGHRRRVVPGGAHRRAGAGLDLRWTPTTRTTRPTSRCRPTPTRARTPRSTSCSPSSAPTRRGRVYAGQPTNWGANFLVGAVPVFKYLEAKDVDEVGYTLRTASLMTDPEYFFDDTNPGDYPLFGIGYILTPASMTPPVPADKVRCTGRHVPVGPPRPRLRPRVRHDRRPDRDPRRRGLAERHPAGLTLARRAARPHGGLQRAAGVDPHGRGPDGAPRAAGPGGRRARRPGRRPRRRRGARRAAAPRSSSARPTTPAGAPRSTATRGRRSWWRRRSWVSWWDRACTRSPSATPATAPTTCCSSWRWPSSRLWPSWPWRRLVRRRVRPSTGPGRSTRMTGDADKVQP